MTLSVVCALVWMLVVNLRAMFPSKDQHWRFAYFMIVLAVPVLVAIYIQHGLLLSLVFLAAAMWIMRWPVIYLTRWIKRVGGYGTS